MEETSSSSVVLQELYQKLVTKYNTLCKRYRDLENHSIKQKVFVISAEERYQAAKQNAKEWQAWIDSHKCTCYDRGNGISKRPVPDPGNQLDDRRTAEDGELTHKNSADGVTSSQTTEADGGSTPIANHDDGSDDEPQVVSVRSVKRKRSDSAQRMPPPTQIKQEPASLSDPIHLDSEDYSSPAAKRKKPMRTEMSDLDALVQHMNTPRKNRRQRAVSNEPIRPMMLPSTVSSLSEGDLPDSADCEVEIKNEAQQDQQDANTTVITYELALQSSNKAAMDDALRPISVNIPSTSKSMNNSMNMKRKRTQQREPFQFGLLSEDGDDQRGQAAGLGDEQTPKNYASHRLDTLLHVPSPARLPLDRRRTPETVHVHHVAPNTKQFDRKDADTTDYEPRPVFKRPKGLEEPPPPLQPEAEPLRLRPRQQLRLEDFKINAKYMGADYAFADTLRGRDQRRCLQGCTRPNCCGDAFRKAVAMGAVQKPVSDTEVLEEYLGPNFATLMGAFAPDKRKDLLVQARAHAFANQHGKHRHAFERRSTPPGFWRTDMPTTQEEQQDRARAQSMEVEKVEERWREAMREGGRWMFRDE